MYSSRFMKLKNFCRFFSDTGLSKQFRVLGIETSCDDTGVAIVDSNRKILGEIKYSQSEAHAVHGGILPPLAKDLHEQNIRPAVSKAVEKSGLSIKDLDAIAVTVKPGIPSSLNVGIEYAKDLCTLYSKPLIPIHHMEAHALTVRLLEDVEFPFLVLLISGAHCILALAESVTKFLVLGEAGGLSPGRFFDLMARRLKLRNFTEYTKMQGGVAIEAAAKKGNPFDGELPYKSGFKDCNFLFKDYFGPVESYIKCQEKKLNIVANGVLPNVYDISAQLQFMIFRHVCERLENAMRYLDVKGMICREKRALVVSGGVASNEFLRKMLKHVCDHFQYELMVPPINLCTDNGVMIAWNGIERLRENVPTVPPDELHIVQSSGKCSLGDDLTIDVRNYAWKGKYLKLEKLMKQESTPLLTSSTEVGLIS